MNKLIKSPKLSDLYPDWRTARAALSAQAGTPAGGAYTVTQSLKYAGKLATIIFKDAPSLNKYEKSNLNLPEIKIDNRFAPLIGTSSEFIAAYAMHGFAKCEPYFELAQRGARVMDRYAISEELSGQNFEAEAQAYIDSLKNYSEINEKFTLAICKLAIFISFFRAGALLLQRPDLQNNQEYALGRVHDVRSFKLTDDIYEAIRFAVQSVMETYGSVKPEFSLNFCRKAFGEIIVQGDGDLYGLDFIGDLKFSGLKNPPRIWMQQLILYWILKVRTDHFEGRHCDIDKISVLNTRTGQLYVMPITDIPNYVIFNAETVFIGIDFQNAIAASFHSKLTARR